MMREVQKRWVKIYELANLLDLAIVAFNLNLNTPETREIKKKWKRLRKTMAL
jgi:hypothetical protein